MRRRSAGPCRAVALLAAALVGPLLGAVGPAGPAAAVTAAPQVEFVHRAGPTELWFFDHAALFWRAVDTSTGTVTRVKATGHVAAELLGAWKKITGGRVDSTGKVRIETGFARAGTYSYRLYLPATTDYASGTSPSRTVKVTRT